MPVTPKLFVTGASGQLGRLVIDTLLETAPGQRDRRGYAGSGQG